MADSGLRKYLYLSAVIHKFSNLLAIMKTKDTFKGPLDYRKSQQQLGGVISGWNSQGLFSLTIFYILSSYLLLHSACI